MSSTSLTDWVEAAEDKAEIQLRQAVHTTLLAISASGELRPAMLIKGGILLAIHYDSERYTRDIDFSTSQLHEDFNEEAFIAELDFQLANASELLTYKLDCRIQGRKLKPRSGATYPTLEIRIGHAYAGTKQHALLAKKSAATVLKIDYSFNEHQAHEPIDINIDKANIVCAYSLADLLGEKYRAVLQQESRNRYRGQDIYDIHMLLGSSQLAIESDNQLRVDVHQSIITKSNARSIDANKHSMRNEVLMTRSNAEYTQLRLTVTDTLPDFDHAFTRVRQYYESLPWL